MLTLNRLCGSGAQSVVTAAQMIMLGEANTMVAGGMEIWSQAPMVLRGTRPVNRLGRPTGSRTGSGQRHGRLPVHQSVGLHFKSLHGSDQR